MSNFNSSQQPKVKYQEALHNLTKDLIQKVWDANSPEEALETLYEGLRKATLESWNNGMQLGMRRSAQRKPQPKKQS